MKKSAVDGRLAKLAQDEDSVATRAELRAIGVTDRMIRTAIDRLRWQQLHAGVYLLSAAKPTWAQLCRAALKAAGHEARLFGETGLAYLGVDGAEPNEIHVAVDRKRMPRIAGVTVHRSRIRDNPRRRPAALTTSSIERLLLDFAATGDVEHVEEAVECTLRLGLTAEIRLWRFVGELSDRVPGVAALTRILCERPEGKAARSKLEIEIFKVLRKAGVPLPVRNYDTWVDGRRYEIDCVYVETLGAIECDSKRFHSTNSQTKKDRQRQAVLEARGWRFVRVTWRDVFGRPEWVVEEVRSLLSGAVLVA